jgi:hypothetical protein
MGIIVSTPGLQQPDNETHFETYNSCPRRETPVCNSRFTIPKGSKTGPSNIQPTYLNYENIHFKDV